MQEAIHQAADIQAGQQAKSFNYNKLQAVVCIASSAVVSIAMMIWAVKNFL